MLACSLRSHADFINYSQRVVVAFKFLNCNLFFKFKGRVSYDIDALQAEKATRQIHTLDKYNRFADG
jgi:hypothetical protein